MRKDNKNLAWEHETMTIRMIPVQPCEHTDIKVGHRYILLTKTPKSPKPLLFLIEVVSPPTGREGDFEAVCHEYDGSPYGNTTEVVNLTLREIGCPPRGAWADIECRAFAYTETIYEGIKYMREGHLPTFWSLLFGRKSVALNVPKMERVQSLRPSDLLGSTAAATIFAPSY